MTFTTIPCHEALQPFIRNYWLLTAQCTAPGTQRIFSNGAASLHFYLTQSPTLDDEDRPYTTSLNRHVLSHMDIHSVEGPFNILGVEFVPFCSRLFFQSEGEANHLAPSDMNDSQFYALDQQIHAIADADAQKQLLDDFFCKRLAEIPINEVNIERMKDVFDDIVPTDESHSIIESDFASPSPSDLASTACLSQKQFTRIFADHVGLNPKSYLRLLRFNKAAKAVHDLATQKGKDGTTMLTEIAWNCGYYDLAHMTKDFRQLCSYSPSEILDMGNRLTDAFQNDFSLKMKKKVLLENIV